MSDWQNGLDQGRHSTQRASDFREGSPEKEGALMRDRLESQLAMLDKQAQQWAGAGNSAQTTISGSGDVSLTASLGSLVLVGLLIGAIYGFATKADATALAAIGLSALLVVSKVADDFRWAAWIKYPTLLVIVLFGALVVYHAATDGHPADLYISNMWQDRITILAVLGGAPAVYIFMRDVGFGRFSKGTVVKCAVFGAIAAVGIQNGAFSDYQGHWFDYAPDGVATAPASASVQQATEPPQVLAPQNQWWVGARNRNCGGYRPLSNVGGFMTWSGDCDGRFISGYGRQAWYRALGPNGEYEGSRVAAVIQGSFSNGRLQGTARVDTPYGYFTGVWQNGVLVSRTP